MNMQGNGGIGVANMVHRRAMMHHELTDFKELQGLAYTYDNYRLPLFPSLYALAPNSTKLAQLQCIPVLGNLYIFLLHIRFIWRAGNFVCLDTSTKLWMLGIATLTLLIGFIPFVNVWAVYKMQPLNSCWRAFSNNILSKGLYPGVSEAGMRTEFTTLEHDNMRPVSQASVDSFREQFKDHYSEGTASSATLSGPPPIKELSDKELDAGYAQTSRAKNGHSSFCPIPGRDTLVIPKDFDSDEKRRSFEGLRVSKIPEEADFLKKDYTLRQSALDNFPLI
ncbi:hypothetical protein GGI23_006562 [Coemansia sp. RSA 2559]|nr:hypothetical protein GGI23_006562 [Coemansia sp. RSA 2559]KAJ2845954.1 hypothetical protein GGI22_006394 [Coemansia erecta]